MTGAFLFLFISYYQSYLFYKIYHIYVIDSLGIK